MLLRFAAAGRLAHGSAPQRAWIRAFCSAGDAAPAGEIDTELKRKWFDAPNLDYAHIAAGISKHLRVHMSPIDNTAVQRLWEHATSTDEIASATQLHERCWLQRGRHGQHRPFSEELSATAFNRALEADVTAAVRLLLRRYRLGLSLTSLSQWHTAMEASGQAGDIKSMHLVWRAMPKNRVSDSTLGVLVDGMLHNDRPDVAMGYVLEWEANGRTVDAVLKSKVEAALAAQSDREAQAVPREEETPGDGPEGGDQSQPT